MTNSTGFTEWIVRCRLGGIAILLSTAIAAGASAQQQETGGSAGQRSTGAPCPPTRMNGSGAAAGPTGVTSYGAPATARATGATTTLPTTTNGTPVDTANTVGVPSSTAPSNTSTKPDNRFTGLNATNGANGVGADTTTTGKHTMTASGSLPADSANARAKRSTSAASASPCVKPTGSLQPGASTNQVSGGDVQLDNSSSASRDTSSTMRDSAMSSSSAASAPNMMNASDATTTPGTTSEAIDPRTPITRTHSARTIPIVKDRG